MNNNDVVLFDIILKIVSDNYNLSKDEIMTSKSGKSPEARHIIRATLRLAGLTFVDIAKLTKCHFSTAISSVNTVNYNYAMHKPDAFAFYRTLLNMSESMRFVSAPVPFNESKFARAYICGAITGRVESEVELKFRLATEKLQKECEHVINPFQYCKDLGIEGWYERMKVLIPIIATVDVIYVLDCYPNSRSGIWEIAIASKVFNLPILKLNL